MIVKLIGLVMVLFLNSCTTKDRRVQSDIKPFWLNHYKQIDFEIDNRDQYKLGFYPPNEGEEGTGVKAITSNSKYVFLLDGFHQNIKKINIKTNNLQASKSLFNENVLDLVLFNNNLYVSGMFGGIYVFDLDLNLISNIELCDFTNTEKYFYSKNNALYVQIPSKLCSFEIKKNMTLGNISNSNLVSIMGESILRDEKFEYSEVDSLLKTRFGLIKLKSPYKSTFNYYNSTNIFYDSNILIYFTIDKIKNNYSLFIYNKVK